MLKFGVFLPCLISVIVWAMATGSLFVAGHGKGLLCTPLYEYPTFGALSSLFDAGGPIYNNGLLKDFGTVNDSVKVSEVLK